MSLLVQITPIGEPPEYVAKSTIGRIVPATEERTFMEAQPTRIFFINGTIARIEEDGHALAALVNEQDGWLRG